ncbi:hypothetical protein SAMN05421676_103238 [Salinibacillus kushneri]|uniref:DUF6884 domain-containing protein n=1 Tax=Salinibacillus kushneri TaxID=237682 RepID=A0A1I0CNN1_9BACI|nr:DUF6884 domain-containing protein [Salinibacillus kushneri]SET21339.1 hypothetical protein SAMN05421676_103238 [Salinibacillus kushneri]
MEGIEKLYVIPSGKPKIWDHHPELEAVKASEAYTGTFHRLLQQYVRMLAVDWVIISPKYGILGPEDIVPESYNLSFRMKNNPNIISIDEMRSQLAQKQLLDVENVIMLGGKKFIPIIEKLFPKALHDYPLYGSKGIGDMQRRLKDAINHEREL